MFGGNLMYFISYLTDILTMTNFFASPPNFEFSQTLNRFTEAPRDNFKFVGNFNYFTLCLTENLTMTNFFTLPPKF